MKDKQPSAPNPGNPKPERQTAKSNPKPPRTVAKPNAWMSDKKWKHWPFKGTATIVALILFALTATAQDFDYSFHTATYKASTRLASVDTATNAVTVQRDTTTSTARFVRVEKTANKLTIHNPSNPTQPFYSETVTFVGTDTDGGLVYISSGDLKETLVVTPGVSVAIIFTQSTPLSQTPDGAAHVFGVWNEKFRL